VTISDTSSFQVVANFAEADMASMKVGDTAVFSFPALKQDAGAGPVTGKVTAIAQNATTSNNVVSYPVTVSIDNPASTLRLGQSANISVTTATADNALLVPTLAITTAGNQQTVMVVKNGQASSVTVKTGISSNGRTEVLSGLGEGDQIELPAVSATVDNAAPSGGQGPGRFGATGGAGGFGGAAGAGGGRG
jgi:multidrug efflux pump subunit AcrA (membrane-fusion protein)